MREKAALKTDLLSDKSVSAPSSLERFSLSFVSAWPFSVTESSPKGNDSILSDNDAGRRVMCHVCASWSAICDLSLRSQRHRIKCLVCFSVRRSIFVKLSKWSFNFDFATVEHLPFTQIGQHNFESFVRVQGAIENQHGNNDYACRFSQFWPPAPPPPFPCCLTCMFIFRHLWIDQATLCDAEVLRKSEVLHSIISMNIWLLWSSFAKRE